MRSLKKGPYVHPKLMKKVLKATADRTKEKIIKTWSRASQIVVEMVGLKIAVHDGRKFIPVLVTEEIIGHRLGEFAPTRTFRKHGGKHLA